MPGPKLLARVALLAMGFIVIIILILGTPLSTLISLLDPFSGVIASSAGYGLIKGELELRSDYLKDEVTIVFDSYGLPHIYASSEEDAYFAVGFLHAWFRLWQMDVQRRLASGRLAEVVGPEAVSSDVYVRIIGLRRSAEATAEWLKSNEPGVYALLESYSRGVNFAMESLRREGRVPLMFKLLDYEPEPWSPVDSIVWGKYMAWTLTNFWEPLELSLLAVKLGPEDVNVLWPVHPYYADNVTVVPGDGEINGRRISVDPYMLRSLNWFSEWATGLDFEDPEFGARLEEAVLDILELVGEAPRSLGSNNWAVAPAKSEAGVAMMADDPHLALNLPSLWYFVRIRVGESLDLFGATLPGIPFVLVGGNRYIAWGLTNTQIGVMDFYVEKVNPEDPSLYYYKGEWRRMDQREEVIKVRGGEDVRLVVNETVHGPVLTTRGLVISFRWTGNAGFDNANSGVTREVLAIYYVGKARNLEEFLEALRYWDVPSQNFMYVDVEGHIAVVEPGIFPTRKVRIPSGEEILVVGSRSVLNGTGDYEWIGYIPYEYVPKAVDPERGFLAAPNQMSVGPYYPYFILGAWWDPGSRAQRIFMLLSSKERHGLEDMASYQADSFDWFAYSGLSVMIDAIERRGIPPEDALLAEALELLKAWDYQMREGEVAPTIWWAWFSALQDEMYESYLASKGVERRFYPPPTTTIWLIYNAKDSKWFPGGFENTVYRALKVAIDKLRESLGGDISTWTWGRVHRLYLGHISGLDALSRGPLPLDGGPGVLMNTPIPWDLRVLEEGAMVRHGPSLRFIAAMSHPGSCGFYWTYPGGQSGNPVSQYYDNLVDVWLSYGHIKASCPESPDGIESPPGTIIISP